eukprot:1158810-Pelagomonas_calceolata.AAC.2
MDTAGVLPLHDIPQRSNTVSCIRQTPQLSANQRNLHLIEIKRYEDKRSGQQSETAQWQHADICKNISGNAVTLNTILLIVGGTRYTEHTQNQLILDHQPILADLDEHTSAAAFLVQAISLDA